MEARFERLPGEAAMVEVVHQPPTPDRPSASILLVAPTDGHRVPVSLTITNYRLHVTPAPRLPVSVLPINIPLQMIETHSRGGDRECRLLTVQTKLVFSFTFGFRDEGDFQRIVKCLDFCVGQASTLQQLPAFEIAQAFRKANEEAAAAPESPNQQQQPDEEEAQPQQQQDAATDVAGIPEWAADHGWALYDAAAELERELVDDPSAPLPEAVETDAGVGKDLRPWFRATDLGQPTHTYGTFATYPLSLVMPNSCSDDLVLRATLFRSRARVPAISYVCLATGGVIARSSQPLLRQSDSARRDDAFLCTALINPYNAQSTRPRDVIQGHSSGGAGSGVGSSPSGAAGTNTAGTSNTRANYVPPPSLIDGAEDEEWVVTAEKDGAPPASSGPLGASTGPRVLHVIDLRPKGAATGNIAMGGGYESGAHYGMCRVAFSGIDNIHGVTAAWQKLRHIVATHNNRTPKADFHERLANSGWLQLVQRVLTAADDIAGHVAKGEPVLTHCTDGWDRTSQATSLAMMLLDPHFRTVRGFCALIEKEFCSFGHKFAERNMHELPGETCGTAHISGGVSDVDRKEDGASPSSPASLAASNAAVAAGAPPPVNVKPRKLQPSPIFSQWLDCVYQLLRQFPTKFEFTPQLLELLAFHVHACFFGTFLCNSAKERVLEGVTTKTISLWSEIDRLVRLERSGNGGKPQPPSVDTRDSTVLDSLRGATRLLNPLYRGAPAGHAQRGPLDRLQPSLDSARIVFWEAFYFKYNSDAWHGMPMSFEAAAMAALPTPTEDPTAAFAAAATERRAVQKAAHEDALARRDPNIRRHEQPASLQTQMVDLKAKQCWRCGDKFMALIRPAAPCANCGHLHCPRCLHTVAGSREKRCESCRALIPAADDE